MTTNTHSDHPRPVPTTARIELPSLEMLGLHGLDLQLEEARLVLVALSWVIAGSKSKTADNVSQLTSAVAACCRVEAYRDGELVPAAHPELPAGWPAGRTALRRLGIGRTDIESYWVGARTRSADACLPLAWVLAFVPAPLWNAVLTVIRWGPTEAAMRLEDAVIELAQQPVARATRRRAAGVPISAGTIRTRVTAVHQLFRALVELRTRALTRANSGLSVSLLEPWIVRPERPDLERCGARPARLDTSGPSFAALQAMLEQLDREVANAKPGSRYFRLRRRAVAGLLLAHGSRFVALRMLDVADYRPCYTFSDGSTGAAMVYRPGKSRHAEETHVVAIPTELANWLEAWIVYTGRELGEQSPLWPAKKPKPGEMVARINASAFARMIGGHAATDGTGSRPLLSRGDNPYIGYNPHAFRHSAYQMARRAGAQALLENPLAYAHLSPDDFARAVVGHGLIRGTGDFYRDLDQEVLARIAVDQAWQALRLLPTPSGLDVAAIHEACTRLEILGAALDECNVERVALETAQHALRRAHKSSCGDELHAAMLESNALVFELARLQVKIADLSARMETAHGDLERALIVEVPLERCSVAEHEAALAGAEARAAVVRARNACDDSQITVRQLAAVLDLSVKTINSWIRSGIPPQRPRLWAEGAWTANERGIRVLPLRLLSSELLPPIARERLHVLRLRLRSASEEVVHAA
jgi:integrase